MDEPVVRISHDYVSFTYKKPFKSDVTSLLKVNDLELGTTLASIKYSS